MVAGIVTEELAVAVPAELLWKIISTHKSPLLLKACAGYIDDVEVDGDGGVGSIVTLKYDASMAHLIKSSKSRVVALDPAARVVKMEVLEAGAVTKQLKTQLAEIKVEAAGEGACVAEVKVDFERHDGAPLEPEHQARLTLAYVRIIKMTEAYHAAHPDELA